MHALRNIFMLHIISYIHSFLSRIGGRRTSTWTQKNNNPEQCNDWILRGVRKQACRFNVDIAYLTSIISIAVIDTVSAHVPGNVPTSCYWDLWGTAAGIMGSV